MLKVTDLMKKPWFFYLLWLVGMCLAALILSALETGLGWLFWGIIPLLVYLCRPGSMLHVISIENDSLAKRVFTILVAGLVIAVCVLPMDQLPLWNGEKPGHRNQYELMAENILEGRIHFDYGDEDQLLKLENPYDPDERKSAGVSYHWDHAYYDGQYYMYFGIVPVFLAFLPYRLLTGMPLTTYHGTQLFVAMAIIGIFALFQMLAKRFFPKMPLGIVLMLSAAVSVMSVWYSAAEPALYCTAITAGIALEVWSLYFFIRAVWIEQRENKQLLLAGFGALLGALVFGCRPTIALANILVIPMLIIFLKQRKFSWALLGKLVCAALPYAVVGLALMLYNYARFDNPFEFGQAYQLTVADQSQYSVSLDAKAFVRILNSLAENFFHIPELTLEFPYLKHGGAFINFPILFLLFSGLRPASYDYLKKSRLTGLFWGFLVAVVVITGMDVLWTPYLLERYRMDIYFLLGIACFLMIGPWYQTAKAPARCKLNAGLASLTVVTVLSGALLCLRQINVYYADTVKQLGRWLFG